MRTAKQRFVGDACHVRKTSELPERAALAAGRLARFDAIIKTLFEDENFITLLRAESMLSVPNCLSSTAGGGDRSRHK